MPWHAQPSMKRDLEKANYRLFHAIQHENFYDIAANHMGDSGKRRCCSLFGDQETV